jgi:uncharacterized protein
MSAPADVLRAALRRDLTGAMRAREAGTVAALRAAIAAIDNAEAVAAPEESAPAASAHVAGARSGAGSAEAERRRLDGSEVAAILREQVADYGREADRYDALGQAAAARRLRDQSRVLARYLPPAGAEPTG